MSEGGGGESQQPRIFFSYNSELNIFDILSETEKNCEAITDRKIISVPLVEITHVVLTRILP